MGRKGTVKALVELSSQYWHAQSVSLNTEVITFPKEIALVKMKCDGFFSSSHLPVTWPRIDLNGHQILLDDPSFPGQT